MRSLLIRVEQSNRRLLAVAIGLGAIVLGNASLHGEPRPSRQAPPATSGSASSAASGPATTPAVASPPGSVTSTGTDVGLPAMVRAALDSAVEYEGDGHYAACLRALAPAPWNEWNSSEVDGLPEELSAAVWRTQRACIRRARAQADKAVRAKDYPAAIASLAPLVDYVREGGFLTVDVEGAWLLSDLAVAYQRNHQYAECIELMGGTHSFEGSDTDLEKVLKAIDYNLAGCQRRLDAESAVKSGGCRISLDGAIAIVAAPRDMTPRGATAACLALVPPNTTQREDEDEACPVVTLVWKGARSAIERKELRTQPNDAFWADLLNDNDFCHGLSSIAVGTMAGKSVVRVKGNIEGHCKGFQCRLLGTLDMFYDWNGEVLTPTLDLTR